MAKLIVTFLMCCVLLNNAIAEGESVMKKAIFAGGCFWCMQEPFDNTPGVVETTVGYTGGRTENPTYEDVSTGQTGHLEAIEVTYDPAKVSYRELVEVFWRQINPTDSIGQFADKGSQYRSAIFYLDDLQRGIAEKSKRDLERSGKFDRPIATRILPVSKFYPAEEYHQDYYRKNASRYNYYAEHSGRKDFIAANWGKESTPAGCPFPFTRPSDSQLKKFLSDEQYQITQKGGTESAFNNEFWDNKREGIYVDIVSGEVLFGSLDKFESGTGWPSFTKPLRPENIVEKEDKSLGMERTEVKSKQADSHLGHVFKDGPSSTGLRYCINSAALRFIPKEDLEKEGYGEYKKMFE